MNADIKKLERYIDKQIEEAKRIGVDHCTVFLHEFPKELKSKYCKKEMKVLRTGYGIYIICW